MRYFVIEKHGGPEYAIIVTDENGNNKLFDTEEEAQTEAEIARTELSYVLTN